MFNLSESAVLGPRGAVENTDDVRLPHRACISQRAEFEPEGDVPTATEHTLQLRAENLSRLVAVFFFLKLYRPIGGRALCAAR